MRVQATTIIFSEQKTEPVGDHTEFEGNAVTAAAQRQNHGRGKSFQRGRSDETDNDVATCIARATACTHPLYS